MNEPMLKKAMDTLEFLSQDAATRMEYDAQMKYLRDEASRMNGAKASGLQLMKFNIKNCSRDNNEKRSRSYDRLRFFKDFHIGRMGFEPMTPTLSR